MLEVRYNSKTKAVTGWCSDPEQFGNLKRKGHTVVILDITIPSKSCSAYLYDKANDTLVNNPDYVEPAPPRDLATELDSLKVRVEDLEGK